MCALRRAGASFRGLFRGRPAVLLALVLSEVDGTRGKIGSYPTGELEAMLRKSYEVAQQQKRASDMTDAAIALAKLAGKWVERSLP